MYTAHLIYNYKNALEIYNAQSIGLLLILWFIPSSISCLSVCLSVCLCMSVCLFFFLSGSFTLSLWSVQLILWYTSFLINLFKSLYWIISFVNMTTDERWSTKSIDFLEVLNSFHLYFAVCSLSVQYHCWDMGAYYFFAISLKAVKVLRLWQMWRAMLPQKGMQ